MKILSFVDPDFVPEPHSNLEFLLTDFHNMERSSVVQLHYQSFDEEVSYWRSSIFIIISSKANKSIVTYIVGQLWLRGIAVISQSWD